MAGGSRRRRHRSRRRIGGLGAGTAALAALILVPAAAAGGWALRPRQCERTAPVQVATTAGFAPVLRAGAVQLAEPDSQQRCVAVQIELRDNARLGAEIGRRAGIGLGTDLPDVWIPDSSLWLALARHSGSGTARLTGVAASLASSPVVVAMPRAVASERGWPRLQPDWRTSSGERSPGIGDPAESAAGLATLFAVGRSDPADPSSAIAEFASRVVVPRLPGGSASAAVGRAGVGAIPTSEQDVVLHNRRSPDAPVAAVYDDDLAGALDFPFVRVASGRSDAAPRWAVTALEDALRDRPARDAAAAAGFRPPDGSALATDAAGALPRRTTGAPTPPDAAVREMLTSWRTLGRRSRSLLLVQTSASMRRPVPGTGMTRLELALEAADAAVRASPPDAELGLWTFGSTPSGRVGHTVQVPVGPLFDRVGERSRRDAVLGALSTAEAGTGTGSALYDSVLDGFRVMERDFVYGRLNSVLVFTDGTQDAGGIDLTALLRRLREEFDGVKPVRVITVAYGAAAGSPSLIKVSDVTGGRSFSSVTAEQVPDLRREVLSEL